MYCDVGEVKERLKNEQSALPRSQLILQPFRHFTYVTAHSLTLLSLLLRQRLFTYVTWRAAHVKHHVHSALNPSFVAEREKLVDG